MEQAALEIRIRNVLTRAVEHQASDVYISAGNPPLIRLEGELLPLPQDPFTAEDTRNLIAQLMNEKQREAFARDLEMNLVYHADGVGRFRANIYMDRGNVGIVLRRVLTQIPSLDSLHLPPVVQKIGLAERGFVLISGPAGSGKSTTLAAVIECHNLTRAQHIITVEDPIEFLHTSKKCLITQREVGIDTHSFNEALRNAVRQSPDVLAIGEMRDRESVEAAVFFAESGHLVLSTVHSSNAAQTIERVINFFPQNQHHQIAALLAQHLKAVISQRLVQGQNLAGLIPAVEIMVNHPRIVDLIRRLELSKLRETMSFLHGDGSTQTLDQHLLQLCEEGTISLEEALRAADSPNELRLKHKTSGKAPR